jgi:O-antigen ligase
MRSRALFPEWSVSTAVEAALASAIALGLALLLVERPALAALLVAAAAAVGLAAVTVARPRAAMAVGLIALAFIPSYAVPRFDTPSVILTMIAGGLALRVALGSQSFRLTHVDIAVAVFLLLLAAPVIFGVRDPKEYAAQLLIWLGPYGAGRLFVTSPSNALFLIRGLAAVALLLVPLIAFERVTGTNPFTRLTLNPSEAATWTQLLTRLGEHRVAASFGHPIALAMFLSGVALLCVSMSTYAERLRERRGWLVTAVVLVVAQSLTLSRTGWLVLGAGIVVFALVLYQRGGSSRLAVALTMTAAVLSLGGGYIGSSSGPSGLFSYDSQEVTANSEYRKTLLQQGLEPGVLAVVGNRTSRLESVRSSESTFSATVGSVDNAYLYLADRWGLLALAGLVLVAMSVLVCLRRAYAGAVFVALPIAAVACFAGLVTVAFITQQQVFVWLLIGACSALVGTSKLTV